MDEWRREGERVARLLWRHIPAANPTRAGVVASDLGPTNGTPMVAVAVGDETRRMAYLPPHAIQAGGSVLVERLDARPDAPWLVVATNYQCPPHVFGPGGTLSTGSALGVGSAGATVSTDWASAMTDPTNEDGALLPLILGEVASG